MAECEKCEDGDKLAYKETCPECGGKFYKYGIHWETIIFSTEEDNAYVEACDNYNDADELGYVDMEKIEWKDDD